MGALILTKGTRRLIGHFNKEFGSSAAHGNIAFYRTNANIALFDQVGGTASGPPYIFGVSEALPANLYPPDNPAHPNLKKRWQYFLTTQLTAGNDLKLINGIYGALHDRSYASITFDAIEDTTGVGQQVWITDEQSDSNTGGAHKKTLRVILVTVPLAQQVVYNGQPVPIDNQDQP
jgi:hypothetical protein